MTACKLAAREGLLLKAALGRLRNVRQELDSRHRGSSDSLMAQRYVSSPFLRSSRRVGFDIVLESHVLGGRGAGGATVVCSISELCKAVNSE